MAAMFERVLGIEQYLDLLANHNHDVMCSSVDVLFLGHELVCVLALDSPHPFKF